MSGTSKHLDSKPTSTAVGDKGATFEITVMSFGFKRGEQPVANVVFDVRFLKNPYWVEELRPLTGMDAPVQKYVLDQKLAQDFLEYLTELLIRVLPTIAETKCGTFCIALGCTGGQHRSTALVEALTQTLQERLPQYKVRKMHRELEGKVASPSAQSQAPPAEVKQ